jgi:hypothetical protein
MIQFWGGLFQSSVVNFCARKEWQNFAKIHWHSAAIRIELAGLADAEWLSIEGLNG